MAQSYFTCNLCEAMCGLRVAMDEGRITGVRGNEDDLLSHGHVCPKAHGLLELYQDPDRLRTPRIREGERWREATWDEAFDLTGRKLNEIRKRHGRDAVGLYYGNPSVHSHRSALAVQLLTTVLGTKNRFDPNSQDSAPRLFACMQMFGDALSMSVPDVERTNHWLILGANPAASNGSMMGLGNPKERFATIRERGGKIVLVDPRRTESAAWATEHHFIRPNGDAALLFAMLHVLFSEKRIDHNKISKVARGLGDLEAMAIDFAPERVGPAIGIEAETIRRMAREFASARGACAYARVGVCQSEFAPIASWLVEALNVVTGNFDREGGAMFAKPAADIGPLGRVLLGNHYGRWKSRGRGLPEFLGSLPSAVMAEEMETPGDRQIRALICMAGNPVLSTPNGPRLERAMKKLEFFVAIDFYLNETTRHADVILPPQHVFETGNYDLVLSRFFVRNVVKYSPAIVAAPPNTYDDWEIASELALRLRVPAPLRRRLRKLVRTLPERIVDVLLRIGPYKTSLEEIARFPHGIDHGPLEETNGRLVRTPDRKIRLAPEVFVTAVPRVLAWVDEARAARDGLLLIGRRHLRSNNSWLHNVRSLAKGPDRARLMIHSRDASRLGLADGGRVRVRSRVGELYATVAITDDVMPGVVSLPHGFGHQGASETLRIAGALPGPNVNAITDEGHVDPLIGNSVLNGVPISIERADVDA